MTGVYLKLAHGTAWHAEFWATRRRVGSGLVDDGIDLLSLTTIIIAVAEYPVYSSLCCAIDIKSPYVQQWPCLVMICTFRARGVETDTRRKTMERRSTHSFLSLQKFLATRVVVVSSSPSS
jgi:hypothetical protein